MRPIHFLLILAMVLFPASVWAGTHEASTGQDAAAESHGHEDQDHGAHGFRYYVVPKILYSFGDDVHHTDGDNALGMGLDLGRRIKGPFSVELSGFLARGDGEETEHHEKLEIEYWGIGVNAVYAWHVSKRFAVPLKLGFIHETETVEDEHGHSHSGSDDGLVYVAGIEYVLTDRTAAVLEIEGTTIDSPKGMHLYLGVSISF